MQIAMKQPPHTLSRTPYPKTPNPKPQNTQILKPQSLGEGFYSVGATHLGRAAGPPASAYEPEPWGLGFRFRGALYLGFGEWM